MSRERRGLQTFEIFLVTLLEQFKINLAEHTGKLRLEVIYDEKIVDHIFQGHLRQSTSQKRCLPLWWLSFTMVTIRQCTSHKRCLRL